MFSFEVTNANIAGRYVVEGIAFPRAAFKLLLAQELDLSMLIEKECSSILNLLSTFRDERLVLLSKLRPTKGNGWVDNEIEEMLLKYEAIRSDVEERHVDIRLKIANLRAMQDK